MASKKSDPDLAIKVAAGFADPLATAALKMLLDLKGNSKLGVIEAFLVSGDLAGLFDYLKANLAVAASDMIAVLGDVLAAAGTAAVQEANDLAGGKGGVAARMRALTGPLASGEAAIAIALPEPEQRFMPANPKTLQAARTWQGNLIREMALRGREKIMETIRDGLTQGQNPRTVARRIRDGLPLTTYQSAVVEGFGVEIDRIAARGMSSGAAWGIYTPADIARMKATDPARFKALNFTATEQKEGRRWAKISRASGTLASDGKEKPSKPIGFVAPPETQGGENAFRIGPDGKPVDGMTAYRLRDKRLDPLLYDVIATGQRRDAALAALRSAQGDAAKAKAAAALAKADAAETAAREALKAAGGEMKARYEARWVKHRSQVIARTEGLRAANLGAYEGWRQSIEEGGLFTEQEVKRVWVTAKDDRVRLDHRGAAGQRRGMREPFIVGGDAVMMPPHQPNCRCTLLYEIDLGATKPPRRRA